MTRNKVRLAYIPNDTARKTTFKKRKAGIVKKLDELTTLCAIEACCIIYSVYEPEPVVWPSVDEARRLMMKFKSFSEVDQQKRKVNQETFTRQRLQKMEEKLRKQQRENRHKEMTQIMFQSMMDPNGVLSMLDMGDYEELIRVTDQNLMEIQRMMEIIRLKDHDQPSFNPPPLPPLQGGSQQLALSHHHEFMPPNQYGFSMPMHNMNFPPPFSHLSNDVPLSHHDMVGYMHPPNMGMPYPANQPMFPNYYHDPDNMAPHDHPSLH